MSVKELITVPDDILRKKSEPLNKVDINEKKLMMIFIIKKKGEQVYCSPS